MTLPNASPFLTPASNGSPQPPRPKETRLSPRQSHGTKVLKRAVKELGSRVIDRRTRMGQALAQWRTDLLRDLGGSETVTTQELAIVDLAVKTKLMLDSVDTWILTQPALINARKRALLPAVRERQILADGLTRYLTQLGLKRRAKPVPSLTEYLSRPDVPSAKPEPAPGEADAP